MNEVDMALDAVTSAHALLDAFSPKAAGKAPGRKCMRQTLKKSRRLVMNAKRSIVAAQAALQCASRRTESELELLRQEVHNERMDIVANATRVFLRLQVSGIGDLEMATEDAVSHANRSAKFYDELLQNPEGARIGALLRQTTAIK